MGIWRAVGADLIIVQLCLAGAIKLDHTASQGQGHRPREFSICRFSLKIRLEHQVAWLFFTFYDADLSHTTDV